MEMESQGLSGVVRVVYNLYFLMEVLEMEKIVGDLMYLHTSCEIFDQ
jgi:hypothetical protein